MVREEEYKRVRKTEVTERLFLVSSCQISLLTLLKFLCHGDSLRAASASGK